MSGGLFSMLWDRVRPIFGGGTAPVKPQPAAKPRVVVRAKRPPMPPASLQVQPTLFDLSRPAIAPAASPAGTSPVHAGPRKPRQELAAPSYPSTQPSQQPPSLRRPPPKRVIPQQDFATGIVRKTVAAKPGMSGKSGKCAKAAPMQERYDTVVRAMLAQYGIKVRKWRKNMSGVAYLVTYKDGSQARFLESPKPKGPMSIAVFLHEIGHHAIGFNVYRPRCLEEFHAWRWSLEAMAGNNLPITDSVRYRVARSLHYAVGKANRRGIREVPPELTPYLERPMKPAKSGKPAKPD